MTNLNLTINQRLCIPEFPHFGIGKQIKYFLSYHWKLFTSVFAHNVSNIEIKVNTVDSLFEYVAKPIASLVGLQYVKLTLMSDISAILRG